jgi:hypothetical protein
MPSRVKPSFCDSASDEESVADQVQLDTLDPDPDEFDIVSLVSVFPVISWPVHPFLFCSMNLLAAYISCSPTLLLERPRPLFFLLLLLPVTDLYVASGAMFTVHSAYPNEIFHDLPQHTDPCVYMYYNLTRQLFGQRYFQLARSILPITFIN